jgi:hypothetical protein
MLIFPWTGQDWRRLRGGDLSIGVRRGGNDANEVHYWG